MLIAWLGASSLTAQTDVTDTYLTNAGFDDESGWITGNIGQATVHAAIGWTATSSGDTWWYGGAIGYGSSLTVNSVTPPATNPEGTVEGGALGLSAGWGCTVKYTQEVTLPAGVYTLSYKAYNANSNTENNNNPKQAYNFIGFTTSSASYYGKVTSFDSNSWTEESVSFVLTAETTGNISIGMGAISGGSGANAKLFVDGVTLTYKSFDEVNSDSPVDMTTLLVNPGFEQVASGTNKVNVPSGWTMKYELSGWLDGNPNTTNPSEGSQCYNLWAGTVNFIDMYQTVTLPAGKYTVYADLRIDNASNITDQGVYASVAGVVTKSGTITNVASTWNSKEGWNTLSATFNNGSTGEVIIGISSTGNGGSSGWFQADNVRLIYLGFDLTEANNALNDLITTAQSIVSANKAAPKTIEDLNTAISAAQSVVQNKDAIEQAAANLTTAINAANATVDSYTKIKALFAECENILTNSEEFEDGAKNTFSTAISNAKTNVESAATADAINNVYNTLETARQTYAQKADPTNGIHFDYTFFVTNPGLDDGKTGWSSEGGAQNKAIATNKTNGIITGNFYENWNPSSFTGSIYQELTGLPSGIYSLTVAAFGNGTKVYANDVTTDVTTDEGTWYEITEVKVGDGNLTFGIKNENNTGWMGIDNVSLHYYGFDVATAQASVTALKTEAEELANQTIMSADVKAKLNSAIASADASKSTRKELVPMIEALNAAISEANAWVAAYNEAKALLVAALDRFEADYNDGENGCKYPINSGTWATVIAKVETATTAKDITDDYSSFATVAEELEAALDAAQVSIDAYAEVAYAKTLGVATETAQAIIESNATSEEVLKATEDLKVLEYTTIMTLYPNDATESFVEGWTTNTFSTASGQSYSGDSHSYPDAWSGSYAEKSATQDITLPAGKYMIKVAGRGQVGASESITVNIDGTETTVPFFMIGDTGLGIDTNGATNFSADGTYANSNAGRGWQWRYVPVALEKATTITVTISGTINKQWISWDDFSIRAADTQVTMSISDAKYSTFIAPFDVEIPTGVEVAKITGVEGNVLTEEAVTGSIPANTPVVLYSETPVSETFSGLSLATADSYKVGYLTGVYTDTEVQAGNYVLVRKKDTGHVGFYLVGETLPTIKANSCYLTVDGSAAPMFSLERGEGTTSIEDAELTNENVVIYDLAGRRVEKMEKGIYIVNGRKVIR